MRRTYAAHHLAVDGHNLVGNSRPSCVKLFKTLQCLPRFYEAVQLLFQNTANLHTELLASMICRTRGAEEPENGGCG